VEAVFSAISAWLGEIGVWAFIVAPLVMAVVSILPIPAEAPALANGMLFGPVVGPLITWIGAMAGAWVSYELARKWGRPIAGRMMSAKALAQADQVVDRAGWWGLLVARFIPLIAFTALNWGAGLCGVRRGRFLWTTALGITPGVIFFTSSGVGLAALYRWSPPLTAAVTVTVVGVSMVWLYVRREKAADR